jgi:hypothetical protein
MLESARILLDQPPVEASLTFVMFAPSEHQ